MLADWLRRRNETGRVLTVALGLLLGGPLAVWLLTIRDPALFQAVFTAAFFCLSWYNGPMTAVIFDVVPPRISATVAGAYLLFIHLAGDAIALPLVGTLSDRFGLDPRDPAAALGRDRGRRRSPLRDPHGAAGHDPGRVGRAPAVGPSLIQERR